MPAASVSLLYVPLALHSWIDLSAALLSKDGATLKRSETVCPNGRGAGTHNSQVKTKLPGVRVLSPSCSLRTGSSWPTGCGTRTEHRQLCRCHCHCRCQWRCRCQLPQSFLGRWAGLVVALSRQQWSPWIDLLPNLG